MESSLRSGSIGPRPSISSAVSSTSASISRAFSGNIRRPYVFLDDRPDLVADLGAVGPVEHGEVEPLEQVPVQVHLHLEKGVGDAHRRRSLGRR